MAELILVSNAAEQHMAESVEDISELRVERALRTNIFSCFFMCRHALKHMKEGSSIINSTSVNAYTGSLMLLDYSATRGVIVAFTRSLALNQASKGIRINVASPGPVWTPLQPALLLEEMISSFGSETPMGRAAQPWEIAPYVFLASPDCSSYISGQVLHPNGLVLLRFLSSIIRLIFPILIFPHFLIDSARHTAGGMVVSA